MAFSIGDKEQIVLGALIEAGTEAARREDGRLGVCPDVVPAGRSVTCVTAVAPLASSPYLDISFAPTDGHESGTWKLPTGG
ncbi:hypothetical protein [Streptomyces purpureus]|uniref:hypothetical protein n=1 Tax=Streptomyces purpureus TaxID=1951 RepID=UPI000373F827|nr:hypothetical protein [Streptomyces purpureus]